MGRKLGFDKVLDCFSLSLCANACVCIHSVEEDEEAIEREALVSAQLDELMKFKDLVDGAKTLAFHLEPKTVELRVSMHCYGCARKVQKHISKIDGEAFTLGFQHYILSLGTAVMIPTMLVTLMSGNDHDRARVVQTLLFVTGIKTLLQTLFGTRLPTIIGGSYAFVIPVLSIIRDPA